MPVQVTLSNSLGYKCYPRPSGDALLDIL